MIIFTESECKKKNIENFSFKFFLQNYIIQYQKIPNDILIFFLASCSAEQLKARG